jgi:hypothetical protein
MPVERGGFGGVVARGGIALRGLFPGAARSGAPLATEDGTSPTRTHSLRWSALRRWPHRGREAAFWTVVCAGALVLFFQLSREQSFVPAPRVGDRGFRERIPVGKLAFVLENDSGLPLRRGDLLDLFLLSEGPEGGAFLHGALVLDASSSRQPILALSPEEIRWVEMARQKGKLRIAVRSAAEKSSSRPRLPRPNKPRKPKSSAIQIWEEQ